MYMYCTVYCKSVVYVIVTKENYNVHVLELVYTCTFDMLAWNSCMFSPSNAPKRERISLCHESYLRVTFCWTLP